jgi:hypothetical protein
MPTTALKLLYAGSDLTTVRILTLDIELPGDEHIRLANSYEDHMLGVEGVMQRFEACGMDIALPARDTSGNQYLQFALGVVDGRAHRLISDALDTGKPAYLVYREYLDADTSAPAAAPKRMLITGGDMSGSTLQVEASYFDLLGITWPRDRYTVENAPGTKYM